MALSKIKSSSIDDGTILDVDVNASAALAFSKMENLTVSRLLVSDGSGDVSVSAVTSTEAGYLDGVTSAIQTQLDAKASSSYVPTTITVADELNAQEVIRLHIEGGLFVFVCAAQ